MLVKAEFPEGGKVFQFDDKEFNELKKRAEKERMLVSQILRLHYREYKDHEMKY